MNIPHSLMHNSKRKKTKHRCPSTGEWVKYCAVFFSGIFIIEYFLAIKRNKPLIKLRQEQISNTQMHYSK